MSEEIATRFSVASANTGNGKEMRFILDHSTKVAYTSPVLSITTLAFYLQDALEQAATNGYESAVTDITSEMDAWPEAYASYAAAKMAGQTTAVEVEA